MARFRGIVKLYLYARLDIHCEYRRGITDLQRLEKRARVAIQSRVCFSLALGNCGRPSVVQEFCKQNRLFVKNDVPNRWTLIFVWLTRNFPSFRARNYIEIRCISARFNFALIKIITKWRVAIKQLASAVHRMHRLVVSIERAANSCNGAWLKHLA